MWSSIVPKMVAMSSLASFPSPCVLREVPSRGVDTTGSGADEGRMASFSDSSRGGKLL